MFVPYRVRWAGTKSFQDRIHTEQHWQVCVDMTIEHMKPRKEEGVMEGPGRDGVETWRDEGVFLGIAVVSKAQARNTVALKKFLNFHDFATHPAIDARVLGF